MRGGERRGDGACDALIRVFGSANGGRPPTKRRQFRDFYGIGQKGVWALSDGESASVVEGRTMVLGGVGQTRVFGGRAQR
jgi:hypothetical protein